MGKEWAADITITEEMVQAILSAQFPELNCSEVQLLDEGWDNAVFLVDGSHIFRFPRRQVAVELILMENRALPWLSGRLPLSIPNPRFIGQPSAEYPFPYTGYLKINGSAPHTLILNDVKRAKSTISLAEFLRALHSIPPNIAIERGIPATDQIGRMDLGKRIPIFVTKVEEAHDKGLIHNPRMLLSGISKLQTIQSNTQQSRVVCHGDLNFRNFLIDNEGALTGVIDWGDAHIGHPSVDLSLAYSYLPPYARSDFFNAYGETYPETLLLAQFRALYTNVVILLYACDIGDTQQILEAQKALSNAISHP